MYHYNILYQWCKIGVQLLSFVMMLLQSGNATAQVATDLARRRVRVSHQNIQQRSFT